MIFWRHSSASGRGLEDEFREIGVLGQHTHMGFDIGVVYQHLLARTVGRSVAHVIEQAFHHGLQPSGADVLDTRIGIGRDLRDRSNAV